MPLAKRIIPCLDVDQGRVLKGVRFRELKDAGDPVELGRKYRDDGADELVFLDITASVEKRKTLSQMVSAVARQLDLPFTVGGGIKTIEDARIVLCSGADKVSVNTAAVERPEFITELAELFGTQCVVVAIDAKRVPEPGEFSRQRHFEVYTYGGRNPTGLDALEWAAEAERMGAGELLVTSIDQDGTEQGYDIALLEALAGTVNIPIIASGGCGNPQHIYEAVVHGKADAALAASIFHFDKYPVPVVKQFLRQRGVEVRL
ncbi:MAG: imidazole glycerol phosphate synthase subunit HisF [Acidobacteria bacterium]|nr:imidazole glycerol phosphate synthase subunit HisF [Acidobacteriota bacterium]